MSETTKNQFYRYSMRTTIAGGGWCAKKFAIQQFPPDNAQSLENLFLHLRVEFNAGMATADKGIARVGIVDSFPGYGAVGSVTRARFLEVNQAAVANIVNLKLDLTSLVDKAAINTTYVFIETLNATNDFTTDLASGLNGGDIWICKLDGIYTTREIR